MLNAARNKRFIPWFYRQMFSRFLCLLLIKTRGGNIKIWYASDCVNAFPDSHSFHLPLLSTSYESSVPWTKHVDWMIKILIIQSSECSPFNTSLMQHCLFAFFLKIKCYCLIKDICPLLPYNTIGVLIDWAVMR